MKYYILFSLVLMSNLINGQSVGIGTTSPESSAILDVKSTTQGFMMPRMTTAQRDAIVAPKQGLQIYNTDDRCLDTYDGSKWAKNCDMKDNGDGQLPANSWRPRADFGGGISNLAVGFSISNKGYVGTGTNGSYKRDFWEFDPTTNVWAQKADFGGSARDGAIGFSMAGKGYLGTGSEGSSLKKDFWEYDPATNVWTQKADFGGTARNYAVGFSIADKGYIGTGFSTSGAKKDFWEYDSATNLWTQKLDFGGTARGNAVGFSIAGKGYIGTGYDGNYKKDFWEFIPAGGGLGSWVQKTDFTGMGRRGAVGFSIINKGYIGTGLSELATYQKDFWEYQPTNNTWTQKADFGGSTRAYAVGFSIGSDGYIGCGLNPFIEKRDFWEYNSIVKPGQEYSENIPADAVVFKGHDWTSSGNNLYTTLDDVNTTTRGLLNADGGFRTKYSGTIVKTIPAGTSNVILDINPWVPPNWDFTNTMVCVSVADDPTPLKVIMYLAKLTSPGVITLSINALAAGGIRFNYIIFKL